MPSNRKRASKDIVRKVNRTAERVTRQEHRTTNPQVTEQIQQATARAVAPIIIGNTNLATYQAEQALFETVRIEDIVIPEVVAPIEFEVNRSVLSFYQEAEPAYPGTYPSGIPVDRVQGRHLWLKTSTGETFRWNGADDWVLVEDKQLLLTMQALGYTKTEMEQIAAGTHPTLVSSFRDAQNLIQEWETITFPDLEERVTQAQAAADGNVTVHYDATQPTGLNDTTDLGDIWYDPDGQAWRWKGSTNGGWVIITDTALTAALGRIQAAEDELDALPAALDARDTALQEYTDSAISSIDFDGLGNKVVRSTSAPPTPPGSDYQDGDSWWQYSGTAPNWRAIGFWILDAGVWQKQSVGDEMVLNLNAGKLDAGIINADRIGANTLGAEKLLVGQFDNLIADVVASSGVVAPHVAGSGASEVSVQAPVADTAGVNPGQHIYAVGSTAAGVGQWRYLLDWTGTNGGLAIPVEPNTQYRISTLVRLAGSYPDGAPRAQWVVRERETTTGPNITFAGIADSITQVTWDWTDCSTVFTTSARTRWLWVSSRSDQQGGVRFALPSIRRMTGSTLIQNGAITTSKIVAGAITAASGILASASILAANIADAQIVNAHIVSLSGDKILANTISAKSLILADFENLIEVTTMDNEGLRAAYPATGAWAYIGYASPSPTRGSHYLRLTNTTTDFDAFWLGPSVGAKEGDQFSLRAMINRLSGNQPVGLSVAYYDALGALISTENAIAVAAGVPSNTDIFYTGNATAPATTASVRFMARLQTTADLTGSWLFDNLSVYRKKGSTLIEDGAIVTDKVAARAIQGSHIKTETILAEHIVAGAITTKQLTIGDFQNLLDEPEPVNLAGWTTDFAGTAAPAAAYIAAGPPKGFSFTSARQALFNKNLVPVKAGDKFLFTADVYRPAAVAGTQGGIRVVNQAGTEVGLFNIAPTTTVDTYVYDDFSVPDDGVTTHIKFRYATGLTGGEIRVTRTEMRRKEAGTLIVEGSISGLKINGQTITGENILADTIEGLNLKAESITGRELGVDSVLARHILAGEIKTNHITAGAITTALLEPLIGTKIAIGSNASIVLLNTAVAGANANADAAHNDLTALQNYFSYSLNTGTPSLSRVSVTGPADPGSPDAGRYSMDLSLDAIEMKNGDSVLTSWNNGRLNADQVNIPTALTIGNHQIAKGTGSHTVIKGL